MFSMLARQPRLATEIALSHPLDALRALAGRPHAFLLHSAMPGPQARWSFFGAEPFEVLRGGEWSEAAERWRALADRASAAGAGERQAGLPPLTGGAVGYLAYDLGRCFERLPAIARDDLGLPDLVLGLYDVVGAFDHRSGRAWLCSSGLPLEGDDGARRAQERLDRFRRALEGAAGAPAAEGSPRGGAAAFSTFSREGYLQAVERVREHIRCGDIFQANLSQRWTLRIPGTPALRDGAGRSVALFEALARHSPAPHAAWLDAGDHAVLSASPERFLRVEGRRVETSPIKGTRPRGADPVRDAELAAELLASEKDRAENVMIVDVLRNDLGRVCEPGSVVTETLCALETFPQVHHLVSTVSGTLRRGTDALDLLRAGFPGGSITGAPKIRAMEVIESLEPVRRHVYTGAIGYLDWSGDADWSIAIRTALLAKDALHFSAGGGIVADSDPEREYEETLHKVEGLHRGLEAVLGPVELRAARA
jgi:para-aminobenzoate synthetase component 1